MMTSPPSHLLDVDFRLRTISHTDTMILTAQSRDAQTGKRSKRSGIRNDLKNGFASQDGVTMVLCMLPVQISVSMI